MIDFTQSITFKGRELPYLCTLNILEWAQNEYGSIGRWQAAVFGLYESEEEKKKAIEEGKTREANITMIKELWVKMINEGIRIQNDAEADGAEQGPVTAEEVGMILSEVGIDGAVTRGYMEVIRCISGGEVKNG